MFLITVLTNEFTFFLYNTSEDNLSTLRSEEHTSELQSRSDLVCRLLLEKKKKTSHTPCPIVKRLDKRNQTAETAKYTARCNPQERRPAYDHSQAGEHVDSHGRRRSGEGI